MSLKTYKQKRDFKKTPEPSGKKRVAKSKQLYVIQKHAASHLHYDFRLEINGVLKSWAVPKGPSLDPTVKRLAVHVEDHPVEYGSFEGIIPQGQYGGGAVMLWDQGEWEDENANAEQAYKKGDLTFILKGKKLKGKWKLIRLKNAPKNWLLMKLNDKYAKPEFEFDVTKKKPLSVVSKRSIEQIAEQLTEQRAKHAETYPLTNPDRILYPEQDITKGDVANYYEAIHEWILPYIINRPLTLVRCPQGRQKKCFYQKHLTHESENLYPIKIKDKEGSSTYLYLKDKKGLMELVQMGVLEIHPWGSRIKDVEKPDMITFDLDPGPEVEWKRVVKAAHFIREKLQLLKLESFVKTTGGKGLHVVVPIAPRHSWDELKTFSQNFVEALVQLKPKDYISKMTKAKRVGKIFVDYMRNQHGATAVAAYSTRAREGATVATPLAWEELTARLKPAAFTIKTVPTRLAKLKKDPWEDFFKVKQSLKTRRT